MCVRVVGVFVVLCDSQKKLYASVDGSRNHIFFFLQASHLGRALASKKNGAHARLSLQRRFFLFYI